MAEYIKKEDVLKFSLVSGARMDLFLRLLQTADVVEVKHGRWVQISSNPWDGAKCSACGRFYRGSEWGDRYCKVCGARMDGE